MEEREECEGTECSSECDEDMSSSGSIARGNLGSPVVSECQLSISERRIQASLPDRLMTVQVVCETPTEITKLSSVPFSILDWWIRETYSNIISPSLEVINGFDKGCRESGKPEKEVGDLGIRFIHPETEGRLTRTIKAARPSIMLEFRVRYAILFLSICEVMEMGWDWKRIEEKKEGEFRATFICTSDVRACYPRRHIIMLLLNIEQCGKR